jgi:chromosome segregation ATPase
MTNANDLRYSTEGAAALLHEIERLRREHEKTWADAALKDAEIEQLREECAHRCAKLLREAVGELHTEIERLRVAYTELDGLRHLACDQRDQYKAEVAGLRQEIERLQKELTWCQENWPG